MRLHFPDAPDQDHLVTGTVAVTHTEDDGVRVINLSDLDQQAQGGVPAHAMLLDVEPCDDGLAKLRVHGQTRCHINARPVQSFAWVRAGDALVVEPKGYQSLTVHLQSHTSPDVLTQPLAASPSKDHDVRLVLRGLSGSRYGQSLSIQPALALRQDADDHLSAVVASIGVTEAGVVLTAEDDHSVLVNGHEVQQVCLQAGDQIQIKQQRYVLEAPGHQGGNKEPNTRQQPAVSAAHAAATDVLGAHEVSALRAADAPTDQQPAVPPLSKKPDASNDMTYVWLIVAAVLICALLFFLLFF